MAFGLFFFLPRLSNFLVYNNVCSCSKTVRHSSSLTQKSLKHLCKDSLYMLTQHSRCYLQVQKKKLKKRGPKTEQRRSLSEKTRKLNVCSSKATCRPFLRGAQPPPKFHHSVPKDNFSKGSNNNAVLVLYSDIVF